MLTETQPAATSGGATKTLKTTTAYNGLTTTVTVNNNGTTTHMPEGVSQTRTTTRNSQGQTVSVADTQANTVTYTYDPFGNLTKTFTKAAGAGATDGVETTMAYDLRGRKTSMTDKNMGSWTYVIDPVGQLRRQTDAKSQVTTFAYDVLGRRTARNEPTLNSTWSYDWCNKAVGKLCEVISNNGYLRYPDYDAQGRLAFIYAELGAGNIFEVSYAYDAFGNVLTTNAGGGVDSALGR